VKNPRVVGALVVGIALVVCAFYVRGSAANTSLEAAIAVADTPRKYVATSDSDGDGMRDWEEELYGTNPAQADKLAQARLTSDSVDRETIDDIPDSMTKKFAISFFSDYLKQAGTGEEMTEEAKTKFLEEAAGYAAQESVDRSFTSADLSLGANNDSDAIRAYGNRVADALTKHTVSTESEIVILERALQTDNAAELAPLTEIVESYSKSLSDLLTMQVPPAFAEEHLELLNALLAVHNNIAAMQKAFSDALPAMVRFQRHPDDMVALAETLSAIATALRLHGTSYGPDEPGNIWNAFSS